jgi:C_GCAxxG_C_C family probable redox protein
MTSEKIEEATACFERGCNCCQSIILTFGPQHGLPKDAGLRLGTGFAGGIARCGKVCGAVSGSIMVIGLKYGMTSDSDSQARNKTFEIVNEFMDKFRSRHESIRCRELLDCDISTPEGRKQARDAGLFKIKCPEFVKSAAEILESLI